MYLLYQRNKITEKDEAENLEHKIEFLIKSSKSLAENKIKNDIEQLLLKDKHENNNIHEHRKQQIN